MTSLVKVAWVRPVSPTSARHLMTASPGATRPQSRATLTAVRRLSPVTMIVLGSIVTIMVIIVTESPDPGLP